MAEQTNEELRKRILVVDDLFPQAVLRKLLHYYQGECWGAGWKTTGTPYDFWGARLLGNGDSNVLSNCETEFYLNPRNRLLGEIWYTIRDLYLPTHELIRCAGAAYTHGRDGFIHTDNKEAGYASMLLYIHPQWETDWGGEIAYYALDGSDVLTMIAPKPGRLIIAPGFIPHRPFAPARQVDQLRACLNFRSRPKR